jgi:4-carboxymuconolactone decarboxylase
LNEAAIQGGLEVAAKMVDERTLGLMHAGVNSDEFGARLGQMALEFAFNEVWKRPGMAVRDRSLVTLGILIALRQVDELQIHIPAALRNGITVQEIEETILQSTVYAGFPAATAAYRVAINVLREAGHLK